MDLLRSFAGAVRTPGMPGCRRLGLSLGLQSQGAEDRIEQFPEPTLQWWAFNQSPAPATTRLQFLAARILGSGGLEGTARQLQGTCIIETVSGRLSFFSTPLFPQASEAVGNHCLFLVGEGPFLYRATVNFL